MEDEVMEPNCYPLLPKLKCRYKVLCFLTVGICVSGCSESYHVTRPDVSRFEKTVASPPLRDSLQAGKIVSGMPYFVAANIFSQWDGRRKTPVPSVGSRQELQEFEGWRRQLLDPNIRVYVDEYETDHGTLSLWYQFPNFYRMNISTNDTLIVFSHGRTFSSVIQCIRSSDMLTVKDKLSRLSDEDSLYAEIHFVENPGRGSNTTYWYLLNILSDNKTFSLRPLSFEYYPIEWIELNGSPVTSFEWRKLP